MTFPPAILIFSWRWYSPSVPFLPSSYGQSLLNPDSFTSTSNLNAKYSVLNTSEILFTLPLKIPGMVHDKREDELPLMWQRKCHSLWSRMAYCMYKNMREDDHSHLTDCLVIETSFLTNRSPGLVTKSNLYWKAKTWLSLFRLEGMMIGRWYMIDT